MKTRMIILKIAAAAALLLSAGAFAEETAALEIDGKSYTVPLPAGFCDASASAWGGGVGDLLRDWGAGDSSLSAPRLLFNVCGSDAAAVYPWGYVALPPPDAAVRSQRDLNKVVRRVVQTQRAEAEAAAGALKRGILGALGVEGDIEIIGPKVVWEDNNSIIVLLVTRVSIGDEEALAETHTVMSSVAGGRVFQFNIHDSRGKAGGGAKKHVKELKKVALRLKRLN